MAVSTEVVTISPEVAQEMLKRNTRNRTIRPSAVARYAHDMKEGNWVLNGEAIMVADDGNLLNGQNRLTACIEAGVPFQTVVVSGLNGNALDSIDTGVQRTLGDTFYWKGIANPKVVSSAVNWLWRYDKMVEEGRRQLAPAHGSRADLIAYLEANPGVIASAAFIEGIAKRLPETRSIGTFVHYLITRHDSEEKANAFFLGLTEPIVDDEESPVYQLRQWLLDHQTLMSRKSPTWIAAMNIKAARFWLQGVPVRRISWKRTTSRRGEEFPRINTRLT